MTLWLEVIQGAIFYWQNRICLLYSSWTIGTKFLQFETTIQTYPRASTIPFRHLACFSSLRRSFWVLHAVSVFSGPGVQLTTNVCFTHFFQNCLSRIEFGRNDRSSKSLCPELNSTAHEYRASGFNWNCFRTSHLSSSMFYAICRKLQPVKGLAYRLQIEYGFMRWKQFYRAIWRYLPEGHY